MALPTERTVTGTYTNPVTGAPYDGTSGDNFVIFDPVPEVWTDQGGNQILTGGGKYNLDVNGSFSEALVVSDAANVLPETGKLWKLRAHVGGEWLPPLYFELPTGDLSPVDITDLASVTIDGITYVPVPGSQGPPGPAGADGADGVNSDQGGLSTGIISGGDISPNVDTPSSLDISPFRGLIVDYLTDPENATVTLVESPTTLTVPMDTGALARGITWWLIDGNLNVTQQPERPTPEQRRTSIVLGVTTQSGGVIDVDQSIPTIVGQPINQLYDLIDAIGAFNISGNNITPNGANLMLNQSSGTVFSRGWNHFNNAAPTNNPHISTTQAQTPAMFRRILRNTTTLPATVTTVDPANYDLNGVLTAVGGSTNNATIQRVWLFPTKDGENQLIIQYGQTVYSSLANAVSAINTSSHVVNPFLPTFGILLGFLCVRRNATNLSDTTQAQFVPAAKFGVGPASSQDALANYLLRAGGTMTGPIAFSQTADDDVSEESRVSDDAVARFVRLVSGAMEWGDGINPVDTFLERIAAGVLALIATDFFVGVQGVKSYRFRQSGSALDVEGAGADIFLSVFQNGDYTGDQFQYLRLENGFQIAHATGRWEFTDGPFGAAVHVLDGFANQVGFHGATPVGQATITGERSTGEALASLLTALGLRGDIVDTSTAGPVKANDADVVKLTGNQTVGGTKTFSLSPTGPTPTTASEMAIKSYVDAGDSANSAAITTLDGQVVKLTGDQTVAGIKTFSSVPVGPASDPTTANQLTRKSYVDAGDAAQAAALLAETHNVFQPEDLGLVAWVTDPANCQSTIRYESAARIRAAAISIHKTTTVSEIVWYMLGYAGGLLDGSWAAIYNSANAKVGTVANLEAPGSEPPEVHDAGGGMSGAPLDEGSVILSPGVYTVVWRFIYNFTTPDGPALLEFENSAGAPPNILSRNGVVRFGYSTAAVTTPPATKPTLLTDGGNRFWVSLA